MTMSLAHLIKLLCSLDGQIKPIECCRTVSTKEITLPITGFDLQKSNPPCVDACSHWKQRWVKQKIRELSKLQGWEMKNRTVSTPLSTSSP
uniref:Chemokine interleukin-8-like domain-containing protein n=1 Tax=Sinocyclocheilus anshuiensis TaxID=1608454 RepID=A0A671KIB9_9TELE